MLYCFTKTNKPQTYYDFALVALLFKFQGANMIILNQEDFASRLHPQQPPKSAYWCSEVFPF